MVGYAYGYYLDPDADLVGISAGEGRAMRHWKVLGVFWVAYWLPYGAMFRAYHRSPWTHWPILSTAIRMVYQFWWVGLMYWMGWLVYEQWHMAVAVGFLVGMSLADALHWAADVLDKKENSHRTIRKNQERTDRIKKNSGRKRR